MFYLIFRLMSDPSPALKTLPLGVMSYLKPELKLALLRQTLVTTHPWFYIGTSQSLMNHAFRYYT